MKLCNKCYHWLTSRVGWHYANIYLSEDDPVEIVSESECSCPCHKLKRGSAAR